MIQKILLTATLALSFAFTSLAQNDKALEQEKENKKEACGKNFEIEKENVVITNDKTFLSGYFAIRFDAKSDVPTTMKIIMKISDCKANVSYISIPMVLDIKSNLWVGKVGIPHLPGCTYSNEALALIVTNECDDEFGETSTEKKNGLLSIMASKFKKLKGKKEKGFEAF